jgi:hypothetical protein
MVNKAVTLLLRGHFHILGPLVRLIPHFIKVPVIFFHASTIE